MDEFICCSNGRPEHFIQDAKYLSCGHLVCSRCIRPLEDFFVDRDLDGSADGCNIECSKCHQLNKLDLRPCPVVKLVETFLKTNMNEYAGGLYSKMKTVRDEVNSEQKLT